MACYCAHNLVFTPVVYRKAWPRVVYLLHFFCCLLAYAQGVQLHLPKQTHGAAGRGGGGGGVFGVGDPDHF